MGTEELYMAMNEKDVENIYRHTFMTKFKNMEITSPFGCDGFGVSKEDNLRVLFEFKDDLNLQSKVEVCKVLAQSIFYIKKFYEAGIVPPSTIFVGDRNECFAVHVNDVIDYLDMDLNWKLAPSSAHRIPELMTRLIQDENINPFVFSSDDFTQCVDKVKDLTENVQRKVLVTDKNITEVFRYFDEKVLGKRSKLTTNEKSNLFVQLLVNRDENYLHPVKRRKMIVTKAFGEVPVQSREGFVSFFAHFASSYSPSQKEKLTAVVDRLVEDATRRKQGEFFTPTIWVDKAHEYIASVYGENWKEEYVVWDPAWGTGNLTRDYKFGELYVSTLNQSDIDTANQMGYNPEATKFQYDFLNDDYEKLPEGLRKAIEEGRQIIVLMNPPYKKSTPTTNDNTIGLGDTVVGRIMSENKMGIASSQLSTQFIYRVLKLNKLGNVNLSIFNKPNYMTSDGFKKLREVMNSELKFEKGFIFNAGHFSDVSSSWGIAFSIFVNGNKSDGFYSHDVLDIDKNELSIFTEGKKILYNCDGKNKANHFFKRVKCNDEVPVVKSALNIVEKNKLGVKNAIGYINNDSNNLMQQKNVFIASTQVSPNGSKVITKNNFNKAVSLFSVRHIVSQNWLNDKDEYLAPNEEHIQFEQFNYDSLVYSLFNSASNQSSLRQIEYKDKLWDIKNEFFWMSKDRMKELADENGYDNLYNDARTSSDRHVYNLLFGEERIYDKLSDDAKAVLDKATELVEQSMTLRQVMADDYNHLDSWDAGYAQLKLVWKEYFEEDFKEFRQLYKNLEDRMRPLVYELGFLMK